MMLDRRRNDIEREERDAWCRTRRLGDFVATFGPTDKIRCPGTKRKSYGDVVCGAFLGDPLPHTSTVVIVGLAPRHQNLGYSRPCPNCDRTVTVTFTTLNPERGSEAA